MRTSLSRTRGWWSRLTLASKLTVSYLGPLVALTAATAIIAGSLVAVQMRRTGVDAAARTADALARQISRAIERHHEAVLAMEAESTARVLEQLAVDPAGTEAAEIAYVAARAVETGKLLFLIDGSGSVLYHPFGWRVQQDPAFSGVLAGLTAGAAGSFFFDNPLRPGAGNEFHGYATPVAGKDMVVVAAGPQSEALGLAPATTLSEALASTAATANAAVILDRDGNLIASSTEWSRWSENARATMTSAPAGVREISRALGRTRFYLAWQSIPSLDASVGAIYNADYLEGLVGRFAILLAGFALVAMVTIPILSTITARFVTAPVNRAARHLMAAAGSSGAPGAGDELARLVRQLLRTSVKLRYERTHREQAEDELEITATVYRNTGEGIVVVNPDGRINRVNPAFTAITGYTSAELRNRVPAVLPPRDKRRSYVEEVTRGLRRDGEWQGEVEITRKSGDIVPLLLSVRAVQGPDRATRGFVAVARDISDIKSTRDRLQHLANHDPLTGLPNRTFLSESLERVLQTRRRRGGTAAALFVDVDHFKDVNDSHGHHAGDELLQVIASRLKATLRAEDIVSRFGGDEFVIVLTDVDNAAMIDEVVRRMLNAVREPAQIERITVRPSVTAGIAIFPDSGTTAEDLLKNADAAMYEAKRIGRGGYRYHDPGMHNAVQMRLQVQDRVRRGLRTEEFALYWQPVFDVAHLRLVGAEALIRWRQGDETLAPASFMPQIEGSQAMLELGEWVLGDTVETLAVNEPILPESFRVAVNVSAIEIIQGGFVRTVMDALSRNGVSPLRLGIEVTEGAVVKDVPTARRVIRELRANGIRVYLDDFGVGYSSLQYLREFGVDAVKLDKSFLSEVPASIPACSLIRGFVDLAHGLGLRTTIEGVERPEQLQYLRSIGCDTVQGFHMGRPVPAEELIRTRITSGSP